MKKFLLKVLLFACTIILVDWVSGFAFDLIQHYAFERDPARFEVRAMYAIEKAVSELDIIGASDASHTYISNMITDSIGLKTYNYGKDGSFFIYQNCLINLMLQNHTPKAIIWEIGKGKLSLNENDKVTEWRRIQDFYPYYKDNNYCKKLINKRDRYQRLYMLSGLYRHNSGILSMLEPFVTHNLTDNSLGGYLPLPNKGYSYPTFQDRKTAEDNIDTMKVNLLKETLDKCANKGVKVIFCFSPQYSYDVDEGTAQHKELMKISEKYQIPVIDYRQNEYFMQDSTFFKDNRHLNDKGAHIYMRYLIPELKHILID